MVYFISNLLKEEVVMEVNEGSLKIVSDETKHDLKNLDIVTPKIYATLFHNHALSHDLNPEESESLADDYLNEKLSLLTSLGEETSKNALQLSDSATRAISAIQKKDENLLNEILVETQELRKEIEKLKESVYKDTLTNTLNRKWLFDSMLNTDARSFKEAGTMVLIDLNYFKIINDTYGHIVGDKVLVYLSHELKNLRGHVIRYGGDEFILIFPKGASEQKVDAKVSALREQLLHKKIKVKDHHFTLSFSYGIEDFEEKSDLNKVIENSDKKMYDDKLKIKERVQGI